MRSMTSISCDRTRALVSCGLDGRLHDLERRFLEAHLQKCAECRAFADEAAWFTIVMRTAPPLEPAFPVALPQRRKRLQARSVASAAAAAFVLIVSGNVALSVHEPEGSEHALVAASLSRAPLGDNSIRSLRRPDLVSGRLSFAPAIDESGLGSVKPALPAAG
jgi:predicted anti-sigma-YlaC factor YlaD